MTADNCRISLARSLRHGRTRPLAVSMKRSGYEKVSLILWERVIASDWVGVS